MQSRLIASIKKSITDKNYWLFVLISAGVGIFDLLIVTAILDEFIGVNLHIFPVIVLFTIVPFVLGTMGVAPFIDSKKSSAFCWLYLAIVISFLVIVLAIIGMSATLPDPLIYLIIIMWCIITLCPVSILYYFAKKLLK